jgi:DNA-binding CsgD family transcriptional regulator
MAATVHQRPTRRQLEVLRTYIAVGSIAAAAHALDITETTARHHLSGLYRRTRCLNAAQAAYWLGAADVAKRRMSSRMVEGRVPAETMPLGETRPDAVRGAR